VVDALRDQETELEQEEADFKTGLWENRIKETTFFHVNSFLN